MSMYAQVIGGIVTLVGGTKEGLPLSAEYLSKFPMVQCIDVTNMTKKPEAGYLYSGGHFYSPAEWEELNRLPPETNPLAEIHENLMIIMLALADMYEASTGR